MSTNTGGNRAVVQNIGGTEDHRLSMTEALANLDAKQAEIPRSTEPERETTQTKAESLNEPWHIGFAKVRTGRDQ